MSRTCLLATVPLVLTLTACMGPGAQLNRARAMAAEDRDSAVDEEFDRMLAYLAEDGWAPIGEQIRGNLEEEYDEDDDVTITIPHSGEFAVLGVCDAVCYDLDLELYDQSGSRVTADFEPDARPVLLFNAEAGDRGRVRVTAADCRASLDRELWLCRYGVQLLAR